MPVNHEQGLRVIFFATFFAILAVRFISGLKIRQRDESSWFVEQEAVGREGLWSIVLRLLLFLWMVTAVVLYAVYPPWFRVLTVPLPLWLRWVGAGLALLSVPLLAWVHSALGRHWSTSLQFKTEHRLIQTGPYRWVRHPMYTVLFSFFIGLGLLSAHIVMLGLAALAVTVVGVRIPKEEAMMVAQFGEEYRTYMQHTGRLLPRLKPRR
ncbi:MAG: isoprenylcysteine carboxylmethyltransferase family protein [Anaerolineae bacterium]|nr:isoprenylcysteine carboxylmethyltransferase family protein [Anaerolineae bacterium]